MTLADLTYATSEQINEIERLGSDRNARRILFEMERDKLIESIRRERKVYFIAHKGGQLIGKDNPRLKRSQIDHAIMRNDLYTQLGCPADWRNEVPIKINGKNLLVADAVFTNNGRFYFIEIDNKTSMQTNNAKIRRYAEIIRNLNRPATLVWYALIESRKKKLRESCEKYGINYEIY